MKTKQIPIIVGLVLITLSNSNAQNFNIGIFTGYDVVNILQKPWDPRADGPPFRPMQSYNLNCFISYKSKNLWGFSVEPGFIQKGGSNGVNNRCRWEFDYLQIPLLVDVYVLHKLSLSAGPEFSYMLNARAANFYPYKTTTDVSSQYNKKFELSGFIGINYMITDDIGLGLGYNHGLTNLIKVPFYGANWEIIGWGRQYTQYLQVKMILRLSTIAFTNRKKIIFS